LVRCLTDIIQLLFIPAKILQIYEGFIKTLMQNIGRLKAMFNHLHQKILMDFFRGRSLMKYKIDDIIDAILSYYD
jgi:hypothetical protein